MSKRIEVAIIGNARSLQRALRQASGSIDGFGRIAGRGLLAAGGGIAAFGALSAKAAIDFESSFAGVRKTVEATEPQFKELRQGFRDLAKEIPASVNELAKIGESAGQLGIQRKALLGFVRTVADLGETTNLVGEDAAASLAKIANVTGLKQTNENFRRLGSTIVDLGNKGASTEADIVAMGLRIAGTGHLVGLSVPQILGLSNALSSMGIEAEAGGTAISQTFSKMQSAVGSGGAKLEAWGKAAGMTGAQFKQAFEKDAAHALVLFLNGLQKVVAQGGDVQGFLQKLGLGGIRVSDTLKKMAGNQQLVNDSLKAGNDAWKQNTALTVEAEKRYKTTASQLKILGNRWTDLKITIGEKMLPIINDAIKKIVQFAEKLEAAPTLKLKFKVITTGLENIWEGVKQQIIDTFIGREVVVGEGQGGTARGVKVKVKPQLEITWGDVKREFMEGFSAAMSDDSGAGKAIDEFWSKVGDKLSSGARDFGPRFKREMGEALDLSWIAGDLKKFIVDPLVGAGRLVQAPAMLIGRNIERGVSGGLSALSSVVRSQFNSLVRTITERIPAAAGAAARLGARVVSGVVSALANIGGKVLGKLNQIIIKIAETAQNAFQAAVAIGSMIVRGVLSGLVGLVSAVGNAIASKVRSAIDWAKGHIGSTAEEYTHRTIGVPMGRGVITGWIVGTADLPSKLSETIRNAIERGRKVVENARDVFGRAFSELSDRILRAFDAESRASETASEKRIREIEERREMEDLIQRQADAQQRLTEAIKEGDAAAIAAAQRDVDRAAEDIALVDLRKQAEQERIQEDSRREELRLQLEKRLEVWEEHFAKKGAKTKVAMQKLTKIMESFGVDMDAAGQLVGDAFVAGLQKALSKVGKAAQGIQVAISAAVSGIGVDGKRALGGPVSAGRSYLVGENGMELFTPNRSGQIIPNGALAGAGTIEVHFHGHVWDKEEVVDYVRGSLVAKRQRGTIR